jgi:hypothetical protein
LDLVGGSIGRVAGGGRVRAQRRHVEHAAAGRHELELVNAELEFRKSVAVQVGAGTTTTPAVELPNGSLSLNALPRAEVTIDGRSLGTTPLGNVSVPIGTYEIIWRHPQLGERRRTVKVPATTPVRVGVDLNQ